MAWEAQLKAEYVDNLGDDLRVANAARVSFDKEVYYANEEAWLEYDEPLDIHERDKRLLKYLAKHDHWTPFAHCMITLRETVPIFVARQRFKHMVGFTYNEVSRRYVDDKPEFHIPEVWRKRPEGSVKQGSLDEPVEGFSMTRLSLFGEHEIGIHEAYENFLYDAENLYGTMIEAGVAPEQARMVLPQSMMTSYYVTGSLAAFARAYKQRIDSHAQREIQVLATEWDRIIRPLYPNAWSALVD